MTEPWNPDMDRLKNELEQAKARMAEANRAGQAMGAGAERERIAAWLEGDDAWEALGGTDNEMPRILREPDGDAVLVELARLLRATPFDALVAKAREQAPDPFHDAGELAAIGHAPEPRDTEPLRREAVTDSGDEFIAQFFPDPEERAQVTGIDRAATPAPEPATRLANVTDRLHYAQGELASGMPSRAEAAIAEALEHIEGTPAPEPRPSTEWLEANIPYALLRALLSHAESTILIDHAPMNDPEDYESACPFCGAASNASTKEPHDEDCVGEQARRWLEGTPAPEPPVSFTRASIVAWLRLGHVSESYDDDSERADAIERGDDVAWANEQDASPKP